MHSRASRRPTRGVPHEELRLRQTRHRRRRRRGRRRTGRSLSCRRHQSARPDEGRHQRVRTVWSMSRACPGSTASRRLPDGGIRIGALVRNADLAHDPDFARSYPAVAEALLVRRISATAQCRDRRRQSAAADAMRIFLRHRQRLQQARARHRLRCPRAARTACTRCSAGAMPASPPIRRISACRWSRSTPSWKSRARAGRREVALEALHRLPGDTPERENALEPGDLIVALRLPGEARRLSRPCTLSESPRTHLLRLCRGVGRRELADRTAARSARRGSRSAALPPSRGVPRRRGDACRRSAADPDAFAARRRRHSPTQNLPATTSSRSNSRGGSWCAP